MDVQPDGLAEREYDHHRSRRRRSSPCHHLSSLQTPSVPSHGNKCQLDAFAEGPPAIHHIDVLATAFAAPASVLVHLSRRGLSMTPFRRERYLRSCGSTIAVKRPELARNTVAGSTVERCEIGITSETLGLESRVEIRATKEQRGPRRTVLMNENEPRIGSPVSTKTTSSPKTIGSSHSTLETP
jgi:hypothetical protein